MKIEHKCILDALETYLTANPTIRFGQALFNLDINEFANKECPEKKGHLLRDNHNDHDTYILTRVNAQMKEFIESRGKRNRKEST